MTTMPTNKVRASLFFERDGRLIEMDIDTGRELSDVCADCQCDDCACNDEDGNMEEKFRK